MKCAELFELLPCPFCGNADTPIVIHDGRESAATCSAPADGCGVRTRWYHDVADAVAAWNLRTTE